MYQSALREHLKAATARVSKGSEISVEERAESRRVLTSRAEPWATWRRFLAENAELDGEQIRRAAIEMLAPILAAESEEAEANRIETEAERKTREAYAAKIERCAAKANLPETAELKLSEPAKPRLTRAESARNATACRAAQIAARDPAKALQAALDSEGELSEAELCEAIERAAALELAAHDRAERRKLRKREARKRYRQRMAQRDSVPAIAAE